MPWIRTQAGELVNVSAVARLRRSDHDEHGTDELLLADMITGHSLPVAAYTDDLMTKLAGELGHVIDL